MPFMNASNQGGRGRVASNTARPASPILGGMSGVDTCEQLLFRVIGEQRYISADGVFL